MGAWESMKHSEAAWIQYVEGKTWKARPAVWENPSDPPGREGKQGLAQVACLEAYFLAVGDVSEHRGENFQAALSSQYRALVPRTLGLTGWWLTAC